MLESLKNKKILVIVAHPDDELLGQGATINLLSKKFNCNIKTVILGEGITSRANERDTDKWSQELIQHKSNITNACEKVGYKSFSTYDFPDNRFDQVNLLDIVKVIESEIETFKPSVIFTHHPGDTNIDHRLTHDAVLPAIRPMKGQTVETLITFETPSSTEWQSPDHENSFIPNFFVEVEEKNIDAKIEGMQSYYFEKREYPHPRSPESLKILSKRWGIVIGTEFAEAFRVIRTISRI
ncbi:PIG-L deacetylase family protein [Salegentibacter salarius]|uniref:GlcNAc-PI de-N-acetylase n=1 Tax=Salegentibacter salarius TaxID=435906 RepID=A0A2N0U561_9FLAO|nr:PIG-L family deacetylase [Salegentibacter salarius]OEY73951.1 hypothetical protein BHS39_00560 [Salegentibacter salarius]PKD22151.1 hypothetical protein APR40_00560 [Salegentibacter salarius]SLJ86320.1 N-acetylglucosaminyl deacetylase, LmbE family [Salegentibacter salarius]